MATSGEQLKKELGLSNYREVRISRVVSLPYKAYFVWYDSFSNLPVTQQRVLRVKRTATMVHGLQIAKGKIMHPQLTPPLMIEYFNGHYKDAYIFLIDVAGDWLRRRKESAGNTENSILLDVEKAEVTVHLDEAKHTGFTVWNFAHQAPSDRNKYFFQIRKNLGHSGSFITDAYFKNTDENKNLVLKFTVKPTPKNGKSRSWVKVMDLQSRVKKARHYVVWILFEALEDLLDPDEIDILRLDKGVEVSKKAGIIRKIFKGATAKVHSNDMSFYWQGTWENAARLGYSIFPFTGHPGKGKWSVHHRGESPAIYITKHILEVMQVLPFNTMQVAKMLHPKEVVDENNRPVRQNTSSDADRTEV